MKKIFLFLLIVINAFSSENIIFINDMNLNLFIKEYFGQLITYIGFVITFITYIIIEKKSKKSSGSILFIGIIASLLIGAILEIITTIFFN